MLRPAQSSKTPIAVSLAKSIPKKFLGIDSEEVKQLKAEGVI